MFIINIIPVLLGLSIIIFPLTLSVIIIKVSAIRRLMEKI